MVTPFDIGEKSMKYKVITQHFGDRQYWAGESREIVNEQDANELIKLGLIALLDEGETPQNGGGDDGKGEQAQHEHDNGEPTPAETTKPTKAKK